MKIRGERECQNCGTRWSYYETGNVECPQCESLKSVGVDDRTEHTASPVSLDLSGIRSRIDEESLRDLTEAAAETCGEYVRQQGFIDAGELQPLEDTYLAAAELVAVSRELDRSLRPDDEEEYYLLDLLRGADQGERPPQEAVPESLRAARGLAYARTVEDYTRDLRTFLDDEPDPTARNLLSTLREHRKRIQALDGDVPVPKAEALVEAAHALGRAVIEDDETALAEARSRLDSLDPERGT